MKFINGYKLIYSVGNKVYANKGTKETNKLLGTLTPGIAKIYVANNAMYVQKNVDGELQTSKVTELADVLVFADKDESGSEDHTEDMHGSEGGQHQTHTVTVKYQGIEQEDTTFTVNVGETQQLNGELPGLATAEGFELDKFLNAKGKKITSVTPLDDATVITAVFKAKPVIEPEEPVEP